MTRSVRRILALLCFLALPLSLRGQITGRVLLREDDSPLPGVIVTLRRADGGRVITFSRTDLDGRFTLEKVPSEPGLRLHFSMLGIAPDSIPLRAGVTHYVVRLREQTTQLHEVTVTAEPIHARGDTIRYLVSDFSRVRDKSIADVLKRMPGIEVSASGQIKYQGVSINRFYIEGKDMLGSRYGVAAHSINPQDVGAVEVMENHQPIKAIRDISFSHNPALNIRLREDAKSRWVGTLSLGAGAMDTRPRATALWDGTGSLMRFRKESQVLASARSANTGETATGLAQAVALSGTAGPDYSLSTPFSLYTGEPSQLDEERYRRGASHAVSVNLLRSLSEEVDLVAQADYSHRTDLSHGEAERTYFFRDEDMVIRSDESGTAHDSRVNLTGRLLVNKQSLYLLDRLSGRID